MKAILLLLLTCLPLWAATTYPLLSDTTNRTVPGGVTNMSLLNANQTFTGTNTFPAASFYPANNVARRMLWRTNDIFIASAAVHADDMTNNGDFALATSVFNVLLPPLLGSNSVVVMGYSTTRTNLNSTVAYLGVYAGTNTNWMQSTSVGAASSIGNAANAANIVVFQNNNSFTSQYQAPSVSGVQFNGGSPITIANTAASWNIYGHIYTVTSYTNLFLRSLWFEEIVIP